VLELFAVLHTYPFTVVTSLEVVVTFTLSPIAYEVSATHSGQESYESGTLNLPAVVED